MCGAGVVLFSSICTNIAAFVEEDRSLLHLAFLSFLFFCFFLLLACMFDEMEMFQVVVLDLPFEK